MDEPMKFYLHVISPVHIGCDDVYEPTGFVIDEQKKKLIAFDAMNFIKAISDEDRKRFSELCSQGSVSSLVSIYKFMSGKKMLGHEVDVASDLIAHYGAVKALPTNDEDRIKQELNKFAISRTAYNPYTNLPYIPGSSVKGALRTAYLSLLAKSKQINNCWEHYLDAAEKRSDKDINFFIGKKNLANRLEKDLMQGAFDTDPFRMVKVSDFLPVHNVRTKIVYAVNKKKKTSKFVAKGSKIPQLLEIIEVASVFQGSVSTPHPIKGAKINNPVDFENLFKSIIDFFNPAFQLETSLLKEIGADGKTSTAIKTIFPNGLGEKSFLVRIGRHSGAEAVTIEGNRDLKIMQAQDKPPKFGPNATTIWLASETRTPSANKTLLPFGWVVLSPESLPIKNEEAITIDDIQKACHVPIQKPPVVARTSLEKWCSALKIIKANDAGKICSNIDNALKELAAEDDKKKFAVFVKEHLGGVFKGSKAKEKLKGYL